MQSETGNTKQTELMLQKHKEHMLQMFQLLDDVSNQIKSNQSVSSALDKLEEFFSNIKQNIIIDEYKDQICAKIQEVVIKIAEDHEPVQLERLLVFLQRQLQYTKSQQYQSYLTTIFGYLMDLQVRISESFESKEAPSDLLSWDFKHDALDSQNPQFNNDMKYLSVILRGAMQILRLAVSSGFVVIACNVSVASLETCEHFYRINEAAAFLSLFNQIQSRKNQQSDEDKIQEVAHCEARTDITSVLLNLKLYSEAFELLKQNGKQLKTFRAGLLPEEEVLLQSSQKCIIRHLLQACKHFYLNKKRLQLLVGLIQVINVSPATERESESLESLLWATVLQQEHLDKENRLRQLFNENFTLSEAEEVVLMTGDLPVWWDTTSRLEKAGGILGRARCYVYSFCASSSSERVLQFLEKLMPAGLPWGVNEGDYVRQMLDEYKQLIKAHRSLGQAVSTVVISIIKNATLIAIINDSKLDWRSLIEQNGSQIQVIAEVAVRPLLRRVWEAVKVVLGDVPGAPSQSDVKNAFLAAMRSKIIQIHFGLQTKLTFNDGDAIITLTSEERDDQDVVKVRDKNLQQLVHKISKNPIGVQNAQESAQDVVRAIISKIESTLTFSEETIHNFYLTVDEQLDILDDRDAEIEEDLEQKQAAQAEADAARRSAEENRARSSLLAEQRQKAVEASVQNNSKICLSFIQKFAVEVGERNLVEILQTLLLRLQREFKTFVDAQTDLQKQIADAESVKDTKLVQVLKDDFQALKRPTPPDLWFRRLNDRANEFFAEKHQVMSQTAQKTAQEAEFKLFCLYKSYARDQCSIAIEDYNKCIHDVKAFPNAHYEYLLQQHESRLSEIRPYVELDTGVLQTQQLQLDKQRIRDLLASYYAQVHRLTFEGLLEVARKHIQALREDRDKKEADLKQIRQVRAMVEENRRRAQQHQQQQNRNVRSEDIPTEAEEVKYKAGGLVPTFVEKKIQKAIDIGICLPDGTVKPEYAALRQRGKAPQKPNTQATAVSGTQQASQVKKRTNTKAEDAQNSELELRRQRIANDLQKEDQNKKEIEMPTQKEIEMYWMDRFLPSSRRAVVENAIKHGLIENRGLIRTGNLSKQ